MRKALWTLVIMAAITAIVIRIVGGWIQEARAEYVQPEWGRCDTDTDCMEKFGGDGSPRPL